MENNNVLSLSLGEYIDKVNDLKQKLEELTQTSSEYKQMAEQLKNVNDSISESLSGFSQKVDAVKQSLENLNIGSDIVSKFDNLKSSLDAISNTDVKIDLNNFLEQIKDADEQVNVLSDKLSNLEINIDAESLSGISEQVTNISAIFEQLNDKLDIVQNNLSDLGTNLEDIDLSVVSEEIDAVSEKTIEVKADTVPIDIAKERILELKEGIAELQAELDKTDTHSQDYQILSNQIEGLQSDLKDLIGDGIDPTIDSMANLISSINEMKDEIQNVEIGSDRFVELSEKIEKLGIEGKSNICFVIGGSLGLSDAILKRADYKLSFSKMTFPHQLMRVILLEQI